MSASIGNLSLREKIFLSHQRIFNGHFFHFQALSILFLLPVFFSLVVYPSFHLALFHPHSHFTTFNPLEIIVFLSYTLFVDLVFLCGIATITYSAVQAFSDAPLNVVSSIKSIRDSFFPLLPTLIVSQTISVLIAVPLVAVFVFVVRTLDSANYFILSVVFLFLGLLSIHSWLQLDWSLAYVVAVVESKSGLEALRRSACLVKGNKGLTFRMTLAYGFFIGVLVGSSMYLIETVGASEGGYLWRSSTGILLIVEGAVFSYFGMLLSLVMKVVLYMYYKESNGEILPLIVGNEYLSLPLDDDEMSRANV